MRDFIRAIRLPNVLIVAMAQILLLHKYNSFSLGNILLVLLTSIWIMWGNMDNDIQDLELDSTHKNKKTNAIILWGSEKSRALLVERLVLFVCVSISIFIGMKAILAMILAWTGLKFYNLYFKKMPLIGNLVIASLCAFSLHIFDLGTANNSSILTSLIFTATLLRELIKDKEDEKADKAYGYRTLAILCPTVSFKITLYFLGTILSVLAYHFMSSVVSALVVFLLIQLGQFYFVFNENWKQASFMIKLQILLGVLMIGII